MGQKSGELSLLFNKDRLGHRTHFLCEMVNTMHGYTQSIDFEMNNTTVKDRVGILRGIYTREWVYMFGCEGDRGGICLG